MKKPILMLLGAWATIMPGSGNSQPPTNAPLIPWSEFKGDTVAYLETNFSSYTYAKRYYPHLNVDHVFNDLEIPIKAIYVDIMPDNSGNLRSIYLLFHSGEYAKTIHIKDRRGDIGILLYPDLNLNEAEMRRFEALSLNRKKAFYRVWDESLYQQLKGLPLNNASACRYEDLSSE